MFGNQDAEPVAGEASRDVREVVEEAHRGPVREAVVTLLEVLLEMLVEVEGARGRSPNLPDSLHDSRVPGRAVELRSEFPHDRVVGPVGDHPDEGEGDVAHRQLVILETLPDVGPGIAVGEAGLANGGDLTGVVPAVIEVAPGGKGGLGLVIGNGERGGPLVVEVSEEPGQGVVSEFHQPDERWVGVVDGGVLQEPLVADLGRLAHGRQVGGPGTPGGLGKLQPGEAFDQFGDLPLVRRSEGCSGKGPGEKPGRDDKRKVENCPHIRFLPQGDHCDLLRTSEYSGNAVFLAWSPPNQAEGVEAQA